MPRLAPPRHLALLVVAFLLASVLLALSASPSPALSGGSGLDVICPASEPCPGAEPYVLNGFAQNEDPVVFGYWPGTVPCDQNGTTFPCPSPSGAPFGPQLAGIEQGIEEWSTAGADVTTVYQLLTAPPKGSTCGGVFSGLDTLYHDNDGLNTVMWAPLGGSVIGLACWWGGTNECDIILDSTWEGFALEEATRTVLLHESGHCMGLSHSTDAGAVMRAIYAGPQHLGADDKAGLIAIYGAGNPPTATSTPTRTPSPTPTATPTPLRCGARTWTSPAATCRYLPGVARD